MANQRGSDQAFIGFWANNEFASKVDIARAGLSRSKFVRDAVKDLLRSKGIDVSDEEASAPDRKGKGGPKYPRPHYALNQKKETPVSSGKSPGEAMYEKHLAETLEEIRARSKIRPSK